MVTTPKLCGPESTVSVVRDLFADDHVHAVLIVDAGVLVAVVERGDLAADLAANSRAAPAGRLAGRIVSPGAPLQRTRRLMLATRRRRLAVVDDNRALLGLLCLKRHGNGFCTDAHVRARAAERIIGPVGVPATAWSRADVACRGAPSCRRSRCCRLAPLRG
jgi:CBS-domain-containing membrane protein